MSCGICKSTCHPFWDCMDPRIQREIQDAEHFIYDAMYSFHLQIEYLEMLEKQILQIMNKKYRLKRYGPRTMLTFAIIKKHFWDQINLVRNHELSATQLKRISDQYESVCHECSLLEEPVSLANSLPIKIKNMLEEFYTTRFGMARNGIPISRYYQLIVYIQSRNIMMANLQMEYDQSEKLDFCIQIDESLEHKECNICLEEKMHAKLGCSHEYCTDCIYETAKVRKKSFITCALCRTPIDVVSVASKDIQCDLLNKIKNI